MATNVKVEKTGTENNISLIRRFTKKIRGSGVLPRVRSIRYNSRPQSKLSKKRGTLRSIEKREKIKELIKMGKISENPRHRGRKR